MKQKHIISIDKSLCIRCGLCQKDCAHRSITVTDRSAEITSQDCWKCGHCVAVCPQNAISISGFADSPEELAPNMKYAPDILMALIKGRRSIRQFTKQEISSEIIMQIIEAGRYTPTGLNRQGVSYVILREHLGECEKIAVSFTRRLRPIIGIFLKPFRRMRIDDHFIFKGATVAIVIKSKDKTDGLLAASAMELAARTHGLGVLYSGMFTRAAKYSWKLRRQLSAVSRGKAVITLVLGYPAVQYQRTAQREQPIVQYY